MKQGEIIALGLAGVAVYMIWKNRSGAAGVSASAPLRSTADAVSEIFDSAGKAFSNGWRYFTDGTAIDPGGNYYSQGQLIWSNPAGATGSW